MTSDGFLKRLQHSGGYVFGIEVEANRRISLNDLITVKNDKDVSVTRWIWAAPLSANVMGTIVETNNIVMLPQRLHDDFPSAMWAADGRSCWVHEANSGWYGYLHRESVLSDA
jgi:hypothetical protein